MLYILEDDHQACDASDSKTDSGRGALLVALCNKASTTIQSARVRNQSKQTQLMRKLVVIDVPTAFKGSLVHCESSRFGYCTTASGQRATPDE